jgi:uncharacterized protein YcbX
MKITALNFFPIKSLAGISLTEAQVRRTGLENDRKIMLIDDENRFVTMREFPKLCLFATEWAENGITVRAQGEKISLPQNPETGIFENVRIWQDDVRAEIYPEIYGEFFSDFLGKKIRLVKIAGNRQVDENYARKGDFTNFADAYPILIANEKSLDFVSAHSGAKTEMMRFRPSIVFDGKEAFEEQKFSKISLKKNPKLTFRLVKPCARCLVTTVNPATGEKTGDEPLKTLALHNQINGKIIFGMNAVPDFEEIIRLGDELFFPE